MLARRRAGCWGDRFTDVTALRWRRSLHLTIKQKQMISLRFLSGLTPPPPSPPDNESKKLSIDFLFDLWEG